MICLFIYHTLVPSSTILFLNEYYRAGYAIKYLLIELHNIKFEVVL